MTRWIGRWNRYWFPTTTTRTLALCRIIAVSPQLYWFPSLLSHINLASKNPDFVDPQVLIRANTFIIPRVVLFTPQGIVLPRTAPFFFFNAILFHIALYLTMGHQFSCTLS